MNQYQLIAHFNEWVNRRLYNSVAQLSDEAYRRNRNAFFGSIHNTLNHLLVVDRLWTGRIAGVDRGIRSLDQILCDDLETLRAARVVEDQQIIDLVDGLDVQRLGMRVTYTRMIGSGKQETRVDHILATLFNHQTHHRGQIHCMLTQEGITPEPWDVIFFLEDTDKMYGSRRADG